MCEKIRVALPEDAAAVARIYNYYVENTTNTFEETPVSEADMRRRMSKVLAEYPWFVSETGGRITGYTFAVQWKGRPAYRYSMESTLYLDPQATGRGLGTRLYKHLIAALRTREFHLLIAAVAQPNPAIEAVHQKLGFTRIGRFEEVGRKFDQWIDVVYWQLKL